MRCIGCQRITRAQNVILVNSEKDDNIAVAIPGTIRSETSVPIVVCYKREDSEGRGGKRISHRKECGNANEMNNP